MTQPQQVHNQLCCHTHSCGSARPVDNQPESSWILEYAVIGIISAILMAAFFGTLTAYIYLNTPQVEPVEHLFNPFTISCGILTIISILFAIGFACDLCVKAPQARKREKSQTSQRFPQ